MKKIICIAILILTALGLCFSQEISEQISASDLAGKLIFERQFGKAVISIPGNYQLANGTFLTNKRALEMFREAPENKNILSYEKAWDITSKTSLIISLGTIVAATLMDALHVSTEDNSWWQLPVVGVSTSLFFLSTQMAFNYRTTAMTNYNLYVMGIPIK
jgi:hypothetical protein